MQSLKNISVNKQHKHIVLVSAQVLYLEHTDGFMKPTGPFPAVSRASLMRVTIDPTTGEEQEVP
jgi:hypothetical protein